MAAWALVELARPTGNTRRPCGAAHIAEVGVSDTLHWNEFVGLKGKIPGVKKPRFELQSGDQLEVSTGRWMVKRRLIDRTNHLYEESVIDAKTGEVRHHCSEQLSQHCDHGSAKPKGD